MEDARGRGASIALLTLGLACALDVQTIRYPEAAGVPPRPEGCEVRVMDWHRTPPASCVDLGDVYVGDSGTTFPCGRERVEQAVRDEACRIGADTALLRWIKDGVSICRQARARLLDCSASQEIQP